MTLTGCTKFGTFILGLCQHCYNMFITSSYIFYGHNTHIHIHGPDQLTICGIGSMGDLCRSTYPASLGLA